MQSPRLPLPFDFRNPDYSAVFTHRLGILQRLRQGDAQERAQRLALLFAFYRDNPIQFVIDWGCTFDPRLVNKNLPAVLPFLPFEKQIGWYEWVLRLMAAGEAGINDKSRDVGASWLAVSLSVALCMFRNDFVVGFGSRKEEYVDKLDSPNALFYKVRMFIRLLPPEFRRGWDERKHGAYMRITFPATGSVIAGEAGDNIGRGDRTSIYFVDESAHLERPELVEASLSATTNCRIDMSSVKGRANPFAKKRFSFPPHRVFTLHWRDDPRKDDAWYERQVADLPAEVVAQEIDINYDASQTGIVIPAQWVKAAIDAHAVLGFAATGARSGALDVADEGIDLNAFAAKVGIHLDYVDAWSGKGSDIFGTVEKAADICDAEGLPGFRYDADGLGAGVRGDVRVLNERREPKGQRALEAEPFRGSAAPTNPDDPIPTASTDPKDKDERINKDFFANAKAQGWWELRVRFQRTYRAVNMAKAGEDWRKEYNADDLISISPRIPRLTDLCAQFSQPTYSLNGAGKVLIDKAPDGTRSPNDADAVMILYAPGERKPRSFFD
jgi:phage terminase large subunit